MSCSLLSMGAICPEVHAQTPLMSSLQEIIDTTSSDSIRMDALFDLAWENNRRDPEKALQLANEGKRLAEKIEDPFWVAYSNYYLGAVRKNRGEFVDALHHFNSLRDYLDDNPDTVIYVNTLYQLAVVKKGMEDMEGALADFNDAILLFDALGDSRSVAMTLNAKATILKNIGRFDDAYEVYEEALSTYESAGDTTGMSEVLNNLGNAYSTNGRYQEALECYNIQEIYDRKTGWEFGLGYVYENRGRLYNLMGKLRLAEADLNESIRIRRKLDSKYTLSLTLIELADVQRQRRRFSDAIDNLSDALSLIDQQPEVERKAYLVLSRVHEDQGNYLQSLSAFRRYEEIKDSMTNESISSRIVEMDARFESAQKEAEIEQFILHEVKRGITKYNIVGGYSNLERIKLVTVCSRRESMMIRQEIAKIDQSAFVTVTSIASVWGVGVGFVISDWLSLEYAGDYLASIL